ncbi:MAG: hypothetical protein NT013_17435 [Planctomycetia bacterium]|nr:hypothetical protein [Planctomycetia bacterium]
MILSGIALSLSIIQTRTINVQRFNTQRIEQESEVRGQNDIARPSFLASIARIIEAKNGVLRWFADSPASLSHEPVLRASQWPLWSFHPDQTLGRATGKPTASRETLPWLIPEELQRLAGTGTQVRGQAPQNSELAEVCVGGE